MKKNHKNPNILILGFGAEGRWALKYLKKKYPRADFTVADQNEIKANLKNVKLNCGRNYLKNLKAYDLIVRSPGVSPELKEIKEAKKAGAEIISLVKLFFRSCRGKIIGVTGTKGKSTTATLLYKILKQAGRDVHLVGNIGRNPFACLNKKNGQGQIFVYELSSYQLVDLEQSPAIAIFLDIFPDHLPYHGGFKNYQAAKANITKHQNRNDYFIFNSRYQFLKNLARRTKARPIDYLKKCRIEKGEVCYGKEKILPLKNIKLLGRHNLENIFACLSAAKILKVNNLNIKKAVADFRGLKHRLEFAGRYCGIDFYDDAISTTPESTLAALEVFGSRVGTIILGGEDRGYDFKKLAQKLLALKVENIILFPNSGSRIWEATKKIYKNHSLPKRLQTRQMEEAIKFAYKNTPAGKICLLSTASPSYSLFKNFKEKGELFKKWIKILAAKKQSQL